MINTVHFQPNCMNLFAATEEQLTEHLKSTFVRLHNDRSHIQFQSYRDFLQLQGTFKVNEINFKLHTTS